MLLLLGQQLDEQLQLEQQQVLFPGQHLLQIHTFQNLNPQPKMTHFSQYYTKNK